MRVTSAILALVLAIATVAAAGAPEARAGAVRGAAGTNPAPAGTPSPGFGRPDPAQPPAGDVSEAGARFVANAGNIVEFGLEGARLAVARTDNEEVRLLADGMVADFQAMHDALGSIATAGNGTEGALQGGEGLDAGRAAALAQLRLASDTDFDRLWLVQQRDAIAEAVTLFEAAAEPRPGGDMAVAELARSSLPRLRENLAALTAAAAGAGVTDGR